MLFLTAAFNKPHKSKKCIRIEFFCEKEQFFEIIFIFDFVLKRDLNVCKGLSPSSHPTKLSIPINSQEKETSLRFTIECGKMPQRERFFRREKADPTEGKQTKDRFSMSFPFFIA